MKTLRALLSCLVLSSWLIPVGLADTLPPTENVEDALGARINNSALAKLANQIEGMIDLDTIAAMIEGQQILDLDLGIAWIRVTVEELYFDEPLEITLTGQASRLTAAVRINNPRLEFACVGEFIGIIDFASDGAVWATRLDISADLQPTVLPDGTINFAVSNVAANFVNFDFDIYDVWNWVMDLIRDTFGDAIEQAAEDAIEVAIMEILPEYVEDFLNELELAIDLDVFGTTIHMFMVPDEIRFDIYGMTVWMNMNSTAPSSDCVPGFPGSFFTYDIRPSYTNKIPGTQDTYEVALALSDDAINRLAYTAYDSGLLCFTIDAEFMQEMGFPFAVNSELFAAAVPRIHDYCYAAPIVIITRPQYPPQVVFRNANETYPIRVSIDDLYMDIYMYGWDRLMHFFTLSVDLSDFGIAVSFIQSTNSIHMELSEEFDFANEVVWDGLMDLSPTEITNLETILPTLINIIMPLLLESLQDIPLPDFYGYTISNVVIKNHGDGSNWLGAFGTLTPVSEQTGISNTQVLDRAGGSAVFELAD